MARIGVELIYLCGTYPQTVTESPHTGAGLYASIRVRPPPDCTLRRLSELHHVQQYMPGIPGGSRPQVVVVEPSAAASGSLHTDGIEEIIWVGNRAVCFLSHPISAAHPSQQSPQSSAVNADRTTADHATTDDRTSQSTASFQSPTDYHVMVSYGFGRLPVAPFTLRLVDGWIELHIVTTAYPKLREAAFDVDLRQVIQSDRPSASMVDTAAVSTVDLSTLTERQREVADVALAMGYFETGGPTAEEIATTLQISKSTLSEHLRIVIRKILSQVLP